VSLRTRIARTSILIVVVGAIATASLFSVVRNDVDKLDRERVDRPAAEALLGVQHLTASVDQILATAKGVVATSGLDPRRFAAVLAHDVNASPTDTLAGMALVTRGGGAPRVVARVGNTHLLTKQLLTGPVKPALGPGSSSALVAFRHDRQTFDLGFGAGVPLRDPRTGNPVAGGAAVYLEVAMPATAPSSAGFALVTRGPNPRTVLGNAEHPEDLVAWNEPVSFGGKSVALLVRVKDTAPGLFGISLPTVVLLAGIALTLLALAAGIVVARRGAAVRHLGDENRLLDEALEQQRVVAAELRASEERFRTIVRDSPDIIVLLDFDVGTSEILNRADFFGHPLEVLAEPGGLYSIVDDDDRADADSLWARMRELEPEQVCEGTLRMRDANGDIRHARLRFSPLDAGDAGDAQRVRGTRLFGAISDITTQSNNDIREAELQEALRRSQRLEAVGHLAGGVAHDFNNLLATILASAELLTDDVPEGRPREYADEIQRAAVRGAALVRELLTFAQRDRAEPRVVELNEIVTGMEALLRRSLGEHVQLQITTTDCSTEIVGDPTHLEQVILNLAVNARDAMPGGGVLWIATAIDFDDDAPQNDRVVLSVTDTGTGIAPDVRDRMFEPFVTTKAVGEGTGLGLSTVQSIVTGMEGRIEVLTRAAEGTTFEVSFARRFGELDPAASPAPADEIDGTGTRILLVEDDDAVRSALAHRLQRLDFDVTTASSAADALQIVEQRTFDLVLTDSVMPGISGPELIEHLRESRPELRIILMSGYTPGESGDDVAPGYLRLRKPFTTPQLARALSLAFQRDSVEQTPT
jgi:signal transduction histidine kinase/ActR/RegA family two-component response regulator